MRESWTDARMDHLNAKVDELGRRMENGFNRVDADLRESREENKAEFASIRSEMNRRFENFDARFDAMQGQLYAMQRLMIQFCGGGLAALLGFIATQL